MYCGTCERRRFIKTFTEGIVAVIEYDPPSSIATVELAEEDEFFEEHEWVDTLKPGTFEPMSRVRHPAMIEPIQHRIDLVTRSTRQWQVVPTITAAGNTRLRQWIPFYEKMKDHRSTKIKKATERALRNVHPPFEEEEPV
ncbi:MAG: hypothetical protein KGD60_08830 [Candidatus Thorarchaeota archaeon]|nr:hypothetical protein [Candidatus Thorarchaeota archaeon]